MQDSIGGVDYLFRRYHDTSCYTSHSRVHSILKGVQAYINEEEQVAAHRKSLISLENISITLTGFVVTYSDLEKHLDFVKAGDEISSFDRSKWVLREKDILDVVRRLQNHKASLSLMLNIINAYIVWVDAKTKESAKSAFLDFAKSLNLELDFQTSGVQLIIDYLNSCLPWLLIFDDVVDVEAIEGCWSRSSKGSIIITTRDPEFCLYLSWKASSDGAMQGQINMKRQPCFPESWFYQEVPGLVRDSAIQLFKSPSFSVSDLTTGIQEAKLIAAIGSSPSLIYAAVEAVNLGLISIVDICGQGYVDFEILAAAENYFQMTKHESTDSITPKLRYREIISQWDDEINRMTAQLTDTSILHLVICFTSSPLEDEISSWIAARLQSKGVDERVTEFGGTFRRYLAKTITCIEGKGSLDLSLTFASDVVSLNLSYNSYRSGYAHITLGMIQIGQKELEAAEKTIESAILCFAQCRKVDYILYYAATANALLGWVQTGLRKHNDAMLDLRSL
ncbi:hypothetical protein TWF706_005129 [Orbilia oligospora]|nr:hypothetical protein TWF706_005129 [Orbilia oligospora]